MCEITSRYRIQKLQAARDEVRKCKEEALRDATSRLATAKEELKNEESGMPGSYNGQLSMKYGKVWRHIEEVKFLENHIRELNEVLYPAKDGSSTPEPQKAPPTPTEAVFSTVSDGGVNCRSFFAKLGQPWRTQKPKPKVKEPPKLPHLDPTQSPKKLLSQYGITTQMSSEFAHTLSSLENSYQHPDLTTLTRDVLSRSEGPLHILEGSPCSGKTNLVLQAVVRISHQNMFSGGIFLIDAAEINCDPIMKMGNLVTGDLPREAAVTALKHLLTTSQTPVLLVFEGVQTAKSVYEIFDLLPSNNADESLHPSKILISTSVNYSPPPPVRVVQSIVVSDSDRNHQPTPKPIFDNDRPMKTVTPTSASDDISSILRSGSSLIIVVHNGDREQKDKLADQLHDNPCVEDHLTVQVGLSSSDDLNTWKAVLDTATDVESTAQPHYWVYLVTSQEYERAVKAVKTPKPLLRYAQLVDNTNVVSLSWPVADLIGLATCCYRRHKTDTFMGDSAHVHTLVQACAGNTAAIGLAVALHASEVSSYDFEMLTKILRKTAWSRNDTCLLRNKQLFKEEHASGNALAVLLRTAIEALPQRTRILLSALSLMRYDSGPVPIIMLSKKVLRELGHPATEDTIIEDCSHLQNIGIISISCSGVSIPRIFLLSIRHNIPLSTSSKLHKLVVEDLFTIGFNKRYPVQNLMEHVAAGGVPGEMVAGMLLSPSVVLSGDCKLKDLLTHCVAASFEIAQCSTACLGLTTTEGNRELNASLILGRLYARLAQGSNSGSDLVKALFKTITKLSKGVQAALSIPQNQRKVLWLKQRKVIDTTKQRPIPQLAIRKTNISESNWLKFSQVQALPKDFLSAVLECSDGSKKIIVWRISTTTLDLTSIAEVMLPKECTAEGEVSCLAVTSDVKMIFFSINKKLFSLQPLRPNLPATLQGPQRVLCPHESTANISQVFLSSSATVIATTSAGDWNAFGLSDTSNELTVLESGSSGIQSCYFTSIDMSQPTLLLCTGSSNRVVGKDGISLFEYDDNCVVHQHSLCEHNQRVAVICLLSTGWLSFLEGDTPASGETLLLIQHKVILLPRTRSVGLEINYFYTVDEEGFCEVYHSKTCQKATRFVIDCDATDSVIGHSTFDDCLQIFSMQPVSHSLQVITLKHCVPPDDNEQEARILRSTGPYQCAPSDTKLACPSRLLYSEQGIVYIRDDSGVTGYDCFSNIGAKLPANFTRKRTPSKFKSKDPPLTSDRFIQTVEGSTLTIIDTATGTRGAIQMESPVYLTTCSCYENRAVVAVLTTDLELSFYEVLHCVTS